MPGGIRAMRNRCADSASIALVLLPTEGRRRARELMCFLDWSFDQRGFLATAGSFTPC